MVHWIDVALLDGLNSFARRSWTFDTTVAFVSDSTLLKGGVILALLWWAWFQPSKEYSERRSILAATLVAALVAVALNCLLVCVLPFRPRPLHASVVAFTLPYGVDPSTLHGWSSFPSDHAVLFTALAVGVRLACPALALPVALHLVLFVLLPRLYLGFHYPSDLLAGGLLGAGTVLLVIRSGMRPLLFRWATAGAERWPGLFYAALFLLTFQIATLFGDARALVSFCKDLVHPLLGTLVGG